MEHGKPHLPIKPVRPLLMVCGRTPSGDPAYFPRAEYHGQRVYFCTEACRDAFRSDPERFYTAHGPKPDQ